MVLAILALINLADPTPWWGYLLMAGVALLPGIVISLADDIRRRRREPAQAN